MSKETVEKHMQQYKTDKDISPANYTQLTEDEARELTYKIVSDMSAESKDMFIINHLMGIWKVYQLPAKGPTKEG